MSWIIDKFYNYYTYLAYFNNRLYEYICTVTYDGVDYIGTIEPGGIKNLGTIYDKHNIYGTLFSSMTLKIQFARKDGGLGEILKTAYEADGIKAEIGVNIRKYNPDTNDFDINFYDGIVDMSDESFLILRDIVECNLMDNRFIARFLARDETNVNMLSTTSLDGDTVAAIPTYDITFKAIDIYLDGVGENGAIDAAIFEYGSGNMSFYYKNGGMTYDRTESRFNLDVSDGIIYNNNTNGVVYIKYLLDYNYQVDLNAEVGNYINFVIKIDTLNSSDVVINSQEILRVNNSGVGEIYEDLDTTYEGVFLEIPVDGYVRFYVNIEYSGTLSSAVSSESHVYPNSIQLVERHPSIGDTVVKCYFITDVLNKACELISGTRCIYSSTTLRNVFLVNGLGLRGFPKNNLEINFRDLFKTINALSNVALYYNAARNIFVVTDKDNIYSNIEVLNLGKVSNHKISTGKHYGGITTGWNSDGVYEKQQGAFEYNIQTTHLMPITIKDKLDLRTSYNGDSILMEITRREQYYGYGSIDTKADKEVFFVEATEGETIQASSIDMQGFIGIEAYYNPNFTPRQNLLRHSNYLKGMIVKQPTDNISFSTAKKDLSNITYEVDSVTINETSDINQTETDTLLYFPEKREFECATTPELLNILNTTSFGYVKYSDEDDNIFYSYIQRAQLSDNNKKVLITAKKANTDR